MALDRDNFCSFNGTCVRRPGHAGVHTACPSSATLDWDHNREVIEQKDIDAAVTLLLLDFPTPPGADLFDEDVDGRAA